MLNASTNTSKASQGTRFYYPDASVVCQPNPKDDVFHDSPVVIIEVISESTRRTDGYEKREAYFSIESLCVYILVEQSVAIALVYRRSNRGFVSESVTGLDAVIPLPEIECELQLNELYEKVTFPTAEQLREQSQGYDP